MTSAVVRSERRPVRALSWSAAAPTYESLPVEPFVAVVIFILCAPAFGAIVPVVAMLALGVVAAIRWRSMAGIVARNWLLFLLPLLAILSAAWSEVPGTSARYGLQFAVTIGIAVVVANTVPARRIAPLAWIAITLASLIGIASGRVGASAGGPVLIGLAGSKNQMGYISLFWLIASAIMLIDRRQYGAVRLAALPCSAIALFMIWQGDAITALLSAVVAAVLILLLTAASVFSRGGRLFLLFAALLMGIGSIAAGPQITAAADRFGTDVLHKDGTLTGRTLLWEAADTLIAQRPVLGHGYKGIWLGPEGVGLLARMGQRDGRAFHFHDTFREIEADLGYTGLALFLIPLALASVKLGILLLDRPTPERTFLVAILAVVGLRIRTELVLAPFLLDTVLLFVVMAYCWRERIGSEPPLPEPDRSPPDRSQRVARRPTRTIRPRERPMASRRPTILPRR